MPQIFIPELYNAYHAPIYFDTPLTIKGHKEEKAPDDFHC